MHTDTSNVSFDYEMARKGRGLSPPETALSPSFPHPHNPHQTTGYVSEYHFIG